MKSLRRVHSIIVIFMICFSLFYFIGDDFKPPIYLPISLMGISFLLSGMEEIKEEKRKTGYVSLFIGLLFTIGTSAELLNRYVL